MKTLVLLVLILSPAVLLLADAGQKEQSQTQTEANVSYEILQQGTYSGCKEPTEKVIADSKDWMDVWKKHVSMLVPQPPPPEVDFESTAVALICAGEKPTSGYQVLITKVVPDNDDIVVEYRLVQPPPNSLTMQVFTQPFVMLKIPKPKGTVRIVAAKR
jgi:hypothetical protein